MTRYILYNARTVTGTLNVAALVSYQVNIAIHSHKNINPQ